MYLPPAFAETRPEPLQALMRAAPLATLVVHGAAGLDAEHVPLLLDAGAGPRGTLRGHVARANPLWRAAGGDGLAALAIFHGPAHYVSPAWYPAKREHGRVVPTWNYVVVHAHGRLCAIDDRDWLRAQIDALSAQQEAGAAAPWSPADAPPDYIERLLGAIVGVELRIERLTGKWKVSQNQSAANRAGVAAALAMRDDTGAQAMAAEIVARAPAAAED